ncbi:MAG: hypothetical protein ACUVRV_06135 [Cyanobacteriota bacterium]
MDAAIFITITATGVLVIEQGNLSAIDTPLGDPVGGTLPPAPLKQLKTGLSQTGWDPSTD